MTSRLNLWHCYFNDFITYKLRLVDQGPVPQCSITQGDFAQQILHTYLHNYLESLHLNEAPQKMAELHCYFSIHQLQLAKTATILRPLSRIERVRKEVREDVIELIHRGGYYFMSLAINSVLIS